MLKEGKNSMKSLLYTIFVIALAFAFTACSTDSAEEATAGTSVQPEQPAAGAGPSAAAAPKAAAAKPADKPAAPARPRTFEVAEGTEVSVLLIDAISTGKNQAGDQFLASLAEPIVGDGETVVDRGAKVQGRIADAEGSGRVKGRANIRLVLTSIVDGGRTYPIVTKPFVAEAEGTKGRDAGILGAAAGIGAGIGAIAGGKGGAKKGAIIGGAAGAGTVLATKGKEVEFAPETKLKFTLEKSAELPKIRS